MENMPLPQRRDAHRPVGESDVGPTLVICVPTEHEKEEGGIKGHSPRKVI